MNKLPAIPIHTNVSPFITEVPKTGKFKLKGNEHPFSEQNITSKQVIGEGCFGIVYKCLYKNYSLEVEIALKSVKVSSFNEIATVVQEAQSLESLKHPNIILCYGHFVSSDKSRVNMALEYMNLKSLDNLINYKKTIPEEMASYIAREILSGLSYIHKNKIYHRDIKPSNILLNRDGQIKIGDFGHAKQMKMTDEPTSTGVGTFKYFSAERLMGEHYTHSVDIWACGLVILEAVLGFFPILINGEPNLIDYIDLVKKFDSKSYQKSVSADFKTFLDSCFVQTPSKRLSADGLLQQKFIGKHSKVTSSDFYKWISSKQNA